MAEPAHGDTTLLDVLARLLEQLTADAPLDDVLTDVAAGTQALVGAEQVSVALFDDGRVRRVVTPGHPVLVPRPAPETPAVLKQAALARRPLVIDDLAATAVPGWFFESATRAGFVSFWSSPVVDSHDRLIGTIALLHAEPRVPDPAQEALLARLSHLAQLAIERDQVREARVAAVTRERRQIAHDIHDDPVQAMIAVSLRLQRLVRKLDGRDAQQLAVEARDACDAAVARLRALVFDLHPVVLEARGVGEAVRQYAEERIRPHGVAVEVHDSLGRRFSLATEDLAYRIVRESLANAVRHGGATAIVVHLGEVDDGIGCTVVDDGEGYDPGAGSSAGGAGHLGQRVHRELASTLGGDLTVTSEPGRGTTVDLWLPGGRVR